MCPYASFDDDTTFLFRNDDRKRDRVCVGRDTPSRALRRASRPDPILSTIAGLVRRRDRTRRAPTDGEIADYRYATRSESGYEVVEDLVRRGLIKDAFVAIGKEIDLEAFHLDAELVGDVCDRQRPEVRLARLRAERRELRADRFDRVVPVGAGVWKGFQQVTGGCGHGRESHVAEFARNSGRAAVVAEFA